MALIYDELAIPSYQVGNLAFPDQALNQRDIDAASRLAAPAANYADVSLLHGEEGLQTLGPLREKLASMHKHERAASPLRDQRGRDNRLTESRRRGKHAKIMARQHVQSRDLSLAQRSEKADRQRCPALPAVFDIGFDPMRSQQPDRLVQAPARKSNVTRVEGCAGNDARLAESRKPHSLRTIELGVLESGETDESGDH
jgi:hypothetical protein